MARLVKSRKKQNKEKRRCKRCGNKLESGNFRWCDDCLKLFREEYKDAEPISEYEIHALPSIIDDN